MLDLIAIGVTSVLALCILYALWPNSHTNKEVPEPEGSWPLLGHSPLLIAQKNHDELHYKLGKKFRDAGMYKIRHNLGKYLFEKPDSKESCAKFKNKN